MPAGGFIAMARLPNVAERIGDLAPFIEDGATLGQMAITIDALQRNGHEEKIQPYIDAQARIALNLELFSGGSNSIAGRLAAQLAPGFKGKIPFDTFAGVVEAIPEKGPALAKFLRGGYGQSKEEYDRLIDLLPATVERPGAAARIAEAKEKRETPEEAAAKAGAVAAATEPSRVRVAAATGVEAARAKQEQEQTEELGVRARLWINPKTLERADPRQSEREVKRLGFIPISEDQAKRATDLQGAKAVVARLDALVDKVFDAEGFLGRLAAIGMKNIGRLLQTDEDAVLYTSFVEGTLAPLIRSLGEKGTLATEDVGRALKLVPTLSVTSVDKRSIARGKIKQLRDLLNDVERRVLVGASGFVETGDDVSKLSDAELKRRLGIK